MLFCLSVFAQTTNLEGYTLLKPDRVGVFAHGDNALEMILMAKYGMKPLDVLRSATSINAAVFRLKGLGNIKAGYLADLVAVSGNPIEDIKVLKKVKLVVKDGVVVKE